MKLLNLLMMAAVALPISAQSGVKDSIHQLDTMTVKAVKEKPSILDVSGKTGAIEMTARDVAFLPSSGQADISRALQLLPGISAGNENSADLIIRGGSAEQNLMIFDEYTLYYIDHFFGFYGPFNIDAVDNVRLFKGGAPARYGSRVAGVIDYTGTSAAMDRVRAGVQTGLLSSSLHVGLPIGEKASLFLAGRKAYSDIMRSGIYKKIFDVFDETQKTMEDFGFLTDIHRIPRFHYYDANAKLRYLPTDEDTVELSGYNGTDYLTIDSRESGRLDSLDWIKAIVTNGRLETSTRWGNWAGSLTWRRGWNEAVTSKLAAGTSRYFLDQWHMFTGNDYYLQSDTDTVRAQFSRVGGVFDNTVSELFAKAETQWRPAGLHLISLGVEGKQIRLKYVQDHTIHLQLIQAGDTSTTDRTTHYANIDTDKSVAAFFIQDEMVLFDRLLLAPGFRLNYFTGTHRYYPEPRASVRFFMTDALSLRGAAGLYHQFVNRATLEDPIEGDRYYFILAGQYGCPVMKGRDASFGAAFSTADVLVDVEAFYKYTSGVAIFPPSYAPTSTFQAGESVSDGIECTLQKKSGPYTGWIGYTYSRTIHKFDKVNNSRPFYSPQDRPHQATFAGLYNLYNFTLSATFILTSGKPYTKPIGKYKIDTHNGITIDYTQWGYKNAARLPPYHRLDASVTYKLALQKQGIFDFGLSVFNVYNNKNARDVEYRFKRQKDGSLYPNTIYNFATKYIGTTPTVFVSYTY